MLGHRKPTVQTEVSEENAQVFGIAYKVLGILDFILDLFIYLPFLDSARTFIH